MYDVIIIGMGPAGMNAALYAKRSGLNVLILEKSIPGGLINITNKVENYLGNGTSTGKELAEKMLEHIKNFDIEYRRESVSEIINEEKIKIVKTNKSEYKAKALILASGRVPKKGNSEKITKLEGKGISYCAVCDAPLYKDKVVGIIGGGNSAFDEGLYISDFAKKLYMFIRSDEIKADEIFVNKAKSKENMMK